ncbi:MAG: hypothetical protein WBB82_09515 [Limnothrix sp.]
MLVCTEIQGLQLQSGLKQAIASLFSDFSPADIPLSLCFQRSGLGYRSAIAKKLAATQAQSPKVLAEQYLEQLAQLNNEKKTAPIWTYHATATEQGWLEFFLNPQSLTHWLECCHHEFRYTFFGRATNSSKIFDSSLTSNIDPFRFQYLQVRCAQLSRQANKLSPNTIGQWHFDDSEQSPIEQALLDSLVALTFALEQGDFSERLLLKLDQAFWDWHRYCPFLGLRHRQPALFEHYRCWLGLIHTVFVACLEHVYRVEAIAAL